jgi:hypothetical protein
MAAMPSEEPSGAHPDPQAASPVLHDWAAVVGACQTLADALVRLVEQA